MDGNAFGVADDNDALEEMAKLFGAENENKSHEFEKGQGSGDSRPFGNKIEPNSDVDGGKTNEIGDPLFHNGNGPPDQILSGQDFNFNDESNQNFGFNSNSQQRSAFIPGNNRGGGRGRVGLLPLRPNFDNQPDGGLLRFPNSGPPPGSGAGNRGMRRGLLSPQMRGPPPRGWRGPPPMDMGSPRMFRGRGPAPFMRGSLGPTDMMRGSPMGHMMGSPRGMPPWGPGGPMGPPSNWNRPPMGGPRFDGNQGEPGMESDAAAISSNEPEYGSADVGRGLNEQDRDAKDSERSSSCDIGKDIDWNSEIWVETASGDEKPYFYNLKTRETVWSRPENVTIIKQGDVEEMAKKKQKDSDSSGGHKQGDQQENMQSPQGGMAPRSSMGGFPGSAPFRNPFDFAGRPPFDVGGRPPFDGPMRPPFDRLPFSGNNRHQFDGPNRPPFDPSTRSSFDRCNKSPFDGASSPSAAEDAEKMSGDGQNNPCFDRPPFGSNNRPQFDGSNRQAYDVSIRQGFDGSNRPPFSGSNRSPFGGSNRPSFDSPNRPPFDGPNRPFFDGSNRPPFDGPNRPPFDGPNRPSFDGSNRPPFDGSNMQSFDDSSNMQSFDGSSRPSFEGSKRHPFDGPNRPSFGGSNMPPFDGLNRPSFDGSNRPPFDGSNRPPFDGTNRPPFDGTNRPPFDGANRPHFDGSNRPPFDGSFRPPFDGSSRPPFDVNELSQFDGASQMFNRPPFDLARMMDPSRMPFDPSRMPFDPSRMPFQQPRGMMPGMPMHGMPPGNWNNPMQQIPPWAQQGMEMMAQQQNPWGAKPMPDIEAKQQSENVDGESMQDDKSEVMPSEQSMMTKVDPLIQQQQSMMAQQSTMMQQAGMQQMSQAAGIPQQMMPQTLSGTEWAENMAPSGQMYYYNIRTMETTWDRPQVVIDAEKAQQKTETAATQQQEVTQQTTTAQRFQTTTLKRESPEREVAVAKAEPVKEEPKQEVKDKSKPIATKGVSGSPWLVVRLSGRRCIVWTGDDRVFFFNPTTRLSLWERPEELADRSDVDALLADPPHMKKSAAVAAGDEPAAKKAKPDDIRVVGASKEATIELEIKAARDRATIPLEERMTEFRTMLEERGVSAFSTWEKELHKIVFDSRYVLLTAKERKQVFEQFVKSRAEEERKERKRLAKVTRDEFLELLAESGVSLKSTFSDFAMKYGREERFRAVEKMRDREYYFNDFLTDQRKREKDLARDRKDKVKRDFIAMLSETKGLDRKPKWRDVKVELSADPRYKLVESSSLREDLFRDFIKNLDLDSEEEEHVREQDRQRRAVDSMKEREKEVAAQRSELSRGLDREREMYRKDEALQNFQSLLSDLIKRTDVNWKDARKILKKDSRWDLADLLERDHKEKVFEEHLEELSRKKRDAFHLMLGENDGVVLTSTWKEVRKLIREDPRFEKFSSSDRKREREFEAFIKEKFLQAKADFKELLRESKIITYKSKRMTEESDTHLADIENVLENDQRYLVLDCVPEERKRILMSYINELDKKGPPPPPTATEPSRRLPPK